MNIYHRIKYNVEEYSIIKQSNIKNTKKSGNDYYFGFPKA